MKAKDCTVAVMVTEGRKWKSVFFIFLVLQTSCARPQAFHSPIYYIAFLELFHAECSHVLFWLAHKTVSVAAYAAVQ